MNAAKDIALAVGSLPTGNFISNADFADSGHTAAAVDAALSRIARKGDLVRVRKGLYWRGVQSRFGSGTPDPLQAALYLAGKGAGPAGHSAARLLGLTTQLPAKPQVAVVGQAPSFEGAHFANRSNLNRLDLSALEVALLEVLRDWPVTVESDWADLVTKVGALAKSGKLDLKAVSMVAATDGKPAVRQRIASLNLALAA